MSLKTVLINKCFAPLMMWLINRWKRNAVPVQNAIFKKLLKKAKHTSFGIDHRFDQIESYTDFKKQVPIRDYEGFRPYIDRIMLGEENILWPGKPLYLAKTSGTTSGMKYIPISKESMPEHIKAARSALVCYIDETGKANFIDGQLIFLQGSTVLEKIAGICVGRLSGIIAHHIPKYLQKNRMPSYASNCIEDWEKKVDAIVAETQSRDIRLISGIPPWIQMYFDRLSEQSRGKKIKDIFKNFDLLIHGGVNFEPYRIKLEETIGKKVDTIETYPASEGFIAFQDSQKEQGLLLLVDAGIFYEFIPVEEYFKEHPTRLSLADIELNIQYALILNTNAGLWAYSIGDTIRFISKDPYRIVVTGRIKHYISAFGEHVIGEEVEHALVFVANSLGAQVTEFTVAPQVHPPEGGLPYHEWFVEFGKIPVDLEDFGLLVDAVMQKKNAYYADLISGKILRPLVLRSLKAHAFIDYMRSQGKLGEQNKVPRLSNDRSIADGLQPYID